MFRFYFRNLRHQSSMVLRAPFCVKIQKGDYSRLVKEGRRLMYTGRDKWEGLRMLVSALSLAMTSPEADRLILDISRGFRRIGEHATSSYYEKMIYYFYPDSKVLGKRKWRIKRNNSYRFPVEYHGKMVKFKWKSIPDNETKSL